jgi:hypothetical protein
VASRTCEEMFELERWRRAVRDLHEDEEEPVLERPTGATPRRPPGKTPRRRLDHGGDRRGNAALYRVALTRSRGDHRTRDYLERRATQGLTRCEAVRCLKRYIAGEIYIPADRKHQHSSAPRTA